MKRFNSVLIHVHVDHLDHFVQFPLDKYVAHGLSLFGSIFKLGIEVLQRRLKRDTNLLLIILISSPCHLMQSCASVLSNETNVKIFLVKQIPDVPSIG